MLLVKSLLLLNVITATHAQADLDAAQNAYPENCRIKSAEMRFVWACRGLASATSRLYTIQEPGPIAQVAGANYCYNSFVMLEEKPGFPIVAKVVRETADGAHLFSYEARENTLPKSPEIEPVMSLKDLNGSCYLRRNPKKACSAVNMAFKLQRAGEVLIPGEIITDRDQLKGYREKSLMALTPEPKGRSPSAVEAFETNEIRQTLMKEMKSRLNSFSDRTLSGLKNGVDRAAVNAYRECRDAFSKFMLETKLDPKWSPEEAKRFADLDRHIESKKIQNAN